MAVLREGKITEEALEEYRRRIGLKLRIKQVNELASKEVIKKFANGLGDVNPLWQDEEYARRTKYGTIVAPPSWLYSVFPAVVQHGLPGVHGFHSGMDWEFQRPVLLGDRIRPECIFTGYEEKPSRFAGRMIMEHQEARYFNQRDELVARGKSWIARAERDSARHTGKYSAIKLPHPWTDEELKGIEDQILAEQIRGSQVRYWEDVAIGDEVGPLVKGPIGVTDEIAWMAGCRDLYAHAASLRIYRRHPSWGFRDPDTYSMEPIAGVHWNVQAAKAAGLPYPYDIGIQRNAWLTHLLTGWMGDDGWIKKCYAEYRRFVYFSDVLWLKGEVRARYKDDNGEYCVDIETKAVTQRGEDAMPGKATVILPSREGNTWPVLLRLPERNG